MIRFTFDSIESLCVHYMSVVSCNKFASIIAKYEDAKQIVTELVKLGSIMEFVELTDPLWDGYNDEFVITIFQPENELYCSKLKSSDGEYLHDDSETVFIMGNCNSKLLSYLSGNDIREVAIVEDDDEWDDELCDDNRCKNHCDCYDCPEYDEDEDYRIDYDVLCSVMEDFVKLLSNKRRKS